MFVCNCNAITEREAKTAIEAGARQWDDVHAFHGCEPCCGMCECDIRDMMGCQKSAHTQSQPKANYTYVAPEMGLAT